MSDNQLQEQIERYLNGEMSKDERARFEILRAENAEVNEKVSEHKHFIGLIKQYGERLELERRLDAIHDEIDVEALEDEYMIHPSFIVRLWRNHHSKISVAASIAIFAVLSTLFFTGYLSNRDRDLQLLRQQVEYIANTMPKRPDPRVNVHIKPGNFSGTGFAITSNGYIITDEHVVRDADSVYVQSNDGKSYKTRVVYSEPQNDIAVLAITDSTFKTLGAIPYGFKKVEADLGENVFTVGYPANSIVFGPGFLTSSLGYQGDSTSYQTSIPVNPGNSGGPLLDNKGNVIGIVDAKQTRVAGAAFATKSSYLLKALQDIPADSLKKPLTLNSKNVLAGLNRVQQIKKIQDFVFIVRVYKQ